MKILVVDDDGFIRKVLHTVLTEWGHEPFEAVDGKAALANWRSIEPDLILMDVQMPYMDGYEAARQIKTQTGDDHLPIVFLTATEKKDEQLRCLEYGDDMLAKPINFDLLQAKLNAHERVMQLNRKVREQNQQLAFFRNKMQSELDVVQYITDAAQGDQDRLFTGLKRHCTAQSAFNGDLVLAYDRVDGGLYVLVADFTGHGLSAAIGSLPVAQTFKTMAQRHMPVVEMARELNRVLRAFLPPFIFCAATLLEVNGARNRVEAWTGGLPDGLLIDKFGRIKHRLASEHMPLAAMADHELTLYTETFALDEGDALYIYTDGVIESRSPADEMYGEDRLEKTLACKLDERFETLLTDVKSFRGDSPTEQDDLSLIELQGGVTVPRGAASPQAAPKDVWHGELLSMMMEEVGRDDPAASQIVASLATMENTDEERESGAAPFCFSQQLLPEHLRQPDPLSFARQVISHHPQIRENKELVFAVIAELFSNAVEHGLLELDSAIKVGSDGFETYYRLRSQRLATLEAGHIDLHLNVRQIPDKGLQLEVLVRNSGKGYAPEEKHQEDESVAFGRGLMLVHDICGDIRVSDLGRCVEVTVPLG